MEPIDFVGHQPVVKVEPTPRPSEKAIYETMWAKPEYRQVAPGEGTAPIFMAIANPPKGAKVIDLGCGTGRGSLMLAILGMDVTMVDFAENCLDADILPMLETQKHCMRFQQADLTKPLGVTAQYGYCTDVMEHIPPEDVDQVLVNCLRACQHVFFQISTVDDVCGALIGHPLHLTVKPYEWWLQKFNDLGCAIHWAEKRDTTVMFYVSAWIDGAEIVKVGELNVEEKQAIENVKTNIAGDWQQVAPCLPQEIEVFILGGGPSLEQYEDEIRAAKAANPDGVKIVTLNGAYDWCLSRGIGPVTQVMVDARPFNARFVERKDEKCRYLIASQVDPSVLAELPKERTWLWHTSAEMIKDALNARYEWWYGIPGGSTVLLRAIPLLRMLGFKKFHLYGCDSCIMGDAHHAYPQSENDAPAFPVTVKGSGRVFMCQTWMLSQAQEFIDLIRVMGDEIEIETHGDGLLNHILHTAAAHDDILA